MSENNLVLNDAVVKQKIRRMAYEIFENNFHEKSIILAGIDGQGYVLAQSLADELESITKIKAKIVKISLDKASPLSGEISIDVDADTLKKKCVVVVDDVLNTGRTLAYGLKPFLDIDVKKIEVAVLVNRSHPMFPIQPTYTGYEVSTALNERVEVVLGKKSAVYLH